MDKRELSAVPRPALTDKQKKTPLLMSNISYFVTAERRDIGGKDTLIMNFFKREKKRILPAFRTFCQDDDYITQDLTVEKTKWKTGAINYLTGYLYWYRKNGNIVINSMKEKAIILGFLKEFRKRHGIEECKKCSKDASTVDMEVEDQIDVYQDAIKARKLAERHKKEKDYIDCRMEKFGDLPEDYGSFVENTVFAEENYIFYSMPQKMAYCSKCKHEFTIDEEKHLRGGPNLPVFNKRDIVKHNQTAMCPWCYAFLHCKSIGMGRGNLTAVQWSVIIQKDGEDILVRYFCHEKDFRKDYRHPKISSWEKYRTIHTADRVEDYEWWRFKNTQEYRWCIYKEYTSYMIPSEYAVPRSTVLYNQDLQEAIEGTCMKYSCIDLYVEHSLKTGEKKPSPWFIDWFFNAYRKSPFLEQLLKVGFYRMTREFLEDSTPPELKGDRSILGTLGINKLQFNMLRRVGDPSLRDLEILKYKPDLKWNEFEILRMIQDGGLHKAYRKFIEFMQYTTLHKLSSYMKKQSIYYYCDYFDYAEWTEEMGYDMHNEFNLFPKDFKKAHDERSKEHIKFKDKQEKEAQRRFNRLLKKLIKETADVEALNLKIGGLFIRLPVKIEELKAEGENLHHCVGNYSERVRKGETMIFFIRQEADPNKSFYTLEWKGRVIQCRGFRNCDMTPEVKAFVKVFEQKMKEY